MTGPSAVTAQTPTAPIIVAPASRSSRAQVLTYLLQVCQSAVPEEALRDVLEVSESELDSILQALDDQALIQRDGSFVSTKSTERPVPIDNAAALERKLLEMLLAFIRGRDRDDPEGLAALDSICTLAEHCLPAWPEVVAGVFDTIDKHVKQAGKKRRVLDVAKLSIKAARQRGRKRTDEMVRNEAVALICGLSWVYQRIDRLDEACRNGKMSLELGHAIGWSRNDAFCKKCLGRLYRMQAEADDDDDKKRKLLNDSAYSLREAIDLFTDLSDCGPRSKEVGECHSLLARTSLMMDDIERAEFHILEADRLIPALPSDCKERIDLQILRGDLEVARDNYQQAMVYYNSVLSQPLVGAVRTEMQARGFLQRGRCRVKLNDQAAPSDLAEATRLFKEVEEQKPAAQATIERLFLTMSLDARRKDSLLAEKPQVVAIALEEHEKRLARVPSGAAKRARDPGDAYWDQLLTAARKRWAREHDSW